MLQAPDTSDIIISLTNIFLPILILSLMACYYKQILKLFDYFSLDMVIPKFKLPDFTKKDKDKWC